MADERVKEREPREAPRGPWEHWKSIALWKQALLVLSVVMMVGAVGVQVYAGASGGPAEPRAQAGEPAPGEPGEPGETSGRGTAPIGIMPGEHEPVEPGQTGPAAPAEAHGEAASEGEVDAWSPAVFRMGFSFFAGFAIAYALRTFVKVSVIAIGLFLLAMFGLQYAGFIEVNWTVVGERYDSAAAWLSAQFESFTTFVTGYLPSAAGGAAGMALGFMKK